MSWRIGGGEITLSAGESVFISRGVVHGFQNLSDAPTTCLAVLTPGALGPEYFQDMAKALGGGAPDPQLMQETMRRFGPIPAP